jgi:hypothetical protein
MSLSYKKALNLANFPLHYWVNLKFSKFVIHNIRMKQSYTVRLFVFLGQGLLRQFASLVRKSKLSAFEKAMACLKM